MGHRSCAGLCTALSIALAACSASYAQEESAKVTVNWERVEGVSRTAPTLQVAVNPFLRRRNIVGTNAYKALHELGADYVRYIPWLPYPRLVVAELEPPTSVKTSWDFSLIDPMTIDFLEATKGHPVVLDFSTIPQWMWKTKKPVQYPANPDQATMDYTQGTEPRDPSFKEIAEYYARLLSWYTQGGFTDELGIRHNSGYHYSIPYWEVLNEVDGEHQMSPRTYTRLYDAVVTAMRKVNPNLKFVSMALAGPSHNPHFFEYFLDHKNHKPGIPLDFISYHFYAVPMPDDTPEVQGFTFFAQAEGFLNTVRYIEEIRKRLSPETGTMITELGAFQFDITKPIPNSHWYLSGALYAYLFGELTRMGIDTAHASMLLAGEPRQHSISLLDWNTGNPNPRFRVLQLLHDNFGPGDKIAAFGEDFDPHKHPIYAMPVITKTGKKRILLVNKSQYAKRVQVPGARDGQMVWVDQNTASNPPETAKLASDTITLMGYSVAAVTLP